MSNIDLGDSPVGTPPTEGEKTQLRAAIGLGASDTVEFGAFIPPSGTTAEIDSISNAEAGQVMFDTDRNRMVRFTGAATYVLVGYPSSDVYYVDPQNGDDSTGAVGALPFATINAALLQAVIDGTGVIVVQCLSGYYDEEDALNGVSSVNSVTVKFEPGSVYANGSMTGALFDTTTATLSNLNYLGGSLTWNIGAYGFFKGSAATSVSAVTIFEIESFPNPSTLAPIFDITGGNAHVFIKGIRYSTNPASPPVIAASGSANVSSFYLTATYPTPFFSVPLPATTLAGTARLRLVGAEIKNGALCEITTDTACKLLLENCKCSNGAFPTPSVTVKAPAASTNPSAYAFGVNAVPAAATNITVDTTFGSFVVDASADDLF